MSETENETPEVTEQAAAPAQEATPAPSFDPSQYATKEDFQQLSQGINYLTQMFQAPEEQEYEEDGGELDLESYMDQYFQRKMGPFQEAANLTIKERGNKIMNDLFDAAQKEYGDFDRKLAERTATSFLSEMGGRPEQAEEATKMAAKYAAEVRKAEREAGESSYRERLQRGPIDPEPAVSGAGNTTRSKAKSYDDVINRWAGETEA